MLDVRSLYTASQVSNKWNGIINEDCDKRSLIRPYLELDSESLFSSSVDHIPDSQPAPIDDARGQTLFSGCSSSVGLSFLEDDNFDSDFIGAATDDTARRISG